MKPNRLKTLREKIDQAKKFDNLHKRPDTDDYAWWNAIGEIDRLKDDCERSESQPNDNDNVS